MSKSAWLLIFIGITAVIAVVILAALNIIDLTPVSSFYLSVFVFGSSNIINAILLTAGFFILGVLFYYALTKYIIGNKIVTNPYSAGPGYNPQPTTPTQPSGNETVIS